MEPFEKDDLTGEELDALLPSWNVPEMPATLKARVFRNRGGAESGERRFAFRFRSPARWRRCWQQPLHARFCLRAPPNRPCAVKASARWQRSCGIP